MFKDKYSKVRENSIEVLIKRKGSVPSKGEECIINFLKSEKVNFIREYFFKDLFNRKTRQLLYFDFYLPEYNVCIEYDGRQHYKKEKSERDITNDFLKTAYCKKNSIPLLRIKFTDFDNIELNICKFIDSITI